MLSLQEAANRIGKSADTLRKAAERGTLTARKIGKTWMTTEVEADRYASENVGKPGPKPKRSEMTIGMQMPVLVEDFTITPWVQVITSVTEKECDTYERLFVSKSIEAKEAGDKAGYAVFALLGALCSLMLNREKEDEPLGPKFVFSGMRSAMVQDFQDDQLTVLAEVLPSVNDAEMRARIADVLWLTKSNRHAAIIAVDAYLESAATFIFDEHNAYERVHRAFRLAVRVRSPLPKVLADIDVRVQSHYMPSNSIYPLWYMDLLFEAKYGEATLYAARAEQFAQCAEAQNKWFAAYPYWNLAAKWHRRAGDNAAQRHALVQAAETYVHRADEEITPPRHSYITAAAHIESAYEVYLNVADSQVRRAALRTQMLDYQRRGMTEMGRISVPIDLTAITGQATALVQGKLLYEALTSLAGCSTSPSIVEMRAAIQAPNPFPLQSLISRVHYTGSGYVDARTPAAFSDDPRDIEAATIAGMIERLRLAQSLHAAGVVEPARTQIMSEHAVTINDLAPIVLNNPLIPDGREMIYARGLLAGLQGDYLLALHLLIPQIENTLRHLLQVQGVNVVGIDSNGIQRPFGLETLLPKPELIAILGEDLIFDLRGLLVEPLGWKLRAGIAHGLLDHDAFYSMGAIYLWWLVLRLCFLPQFAVRTGGKSEPPDMSNSNAATSELSLPPS